MNTFKYLLKYYLLMIVIFFIGRVILFDIYLDSFIDSGENYWLTFLYGIRMDTITASILLVIPLLLISFAPKTLKRVVEVFLKYYFLIIISILIYIEVATFPFFAQYDVRPNYLFVEYLEYPKEVFSMILADYKFELFVAILLISLFVFIYLKKIRDDLDEVFNIPYIKRILLFLPLGILLFIGIRSSFGHRPANISDALYSTDRTINEITKNSPYSILYAIYINNLSNSKNLIKRYGEIEIDEAIDRVNKLLNINSEDRKSPLRRVEKSHFKTKNPKNLIIFLQESLGGQFVKAVGGEEGITPNLNQLAKEGIVFRELYSNGTRSIRGIAGVVSGIFSIPGEGVVKRNKSQNNFFTFAKLLKPYGYHTSFIYGGESRFDNMKGWFLGNGFDEIIDESKFNDPKFVGTWGVCDGEVVKRANKEFKKLHDSGKRFASIIFSTSNHTPFDYPLDKITPIKGEKLKSVKNAIKYADYAIGHLVDLAKKSGYFDDTIIAIVADHNIRVYGKDMVPVNMFHIPGVIVGGGVEPKVYEKLSTQPDLLATVLDLIGLDLSYPIMGNSIFSDKKRELSLMQFNNYYALRVKDRVTILRPNKKPKTFLYKDGHLHPLKLDKEMARDALSFITLLNYLYQNQLYR